VLHLVSGVPSRTDFMGHLFNVDEEKNVYFNRFFTAKILATRKKEANPVKF
jgi:hypothetical protein